MGSVGQMTHQSMVLENAFFEIDCSLDRSRRGTRYRLAGCIVLI